MGEHWIPLIIPITLPSSQIFRLSGLNMAEWQLSQIPISSTTNVMSSVNENISAIPHDLDSCELQTQHYLDHLVDRRPLKVSFEPA